MPEKADSMGSCERSDDPVAGNECLPLSLMKNSRKKNPGADIYSLQEGKSDQQRLI